VITPSYTLVLQHLHSTIQPGKSVGKISHSSTSGIISSGSASSSFVQPRPARPLLSREDDYNHVFPTLSAGLKRCQTSKREADPSYLQSAEMKAPSGYSVGYSGYWTCLSNPKRRARLWVLPSLSLRKQSCLSTSISTSNLRVCQSLREPLREPLLRSKGRLEPARRVRIKLCCCETVTSRNNNGYHSQRLGCVCMSSQMSQPSISSCY
jgi:hypothetical protein